MWCCSHKFAVASSDASLSANDLTQLMPPSLTIITSSRGLPFPMERSASVGHAEVGSLDSWAEDDSRKDAHNWYRAFSH